MPSKNYTYLALGDSYTVGESLPLLENFPYQAVQLLRNRNLDFHAPEIIAKTGWTTNELLLHLDKIKLRPSYDFVSLLIGVNNQYRGQKIEIYKEEFNLLLDKAISWAGNNSTHVIVLSIPDWSVTPYATGRDTGTIAKEIDAFNEINARFARIKHVHYIDITPGTREAANDERLLATDKLHPSALEYKRWATALAEYIATQL